MSAPKTWSNKSVRRLAGSRDPVSVISERARAVVARALDGGWSGPPFDPFWLAQFLKITVVARDDVPEARTLATPKGQMKVEINPSRPQGRVRFSLAHEIAHTLFPDCAQEVRHRGRHGHEAADEWQLEALCNLAAAEFLMPVGHLRTAADAIDIDMVIAQQREFQVSTETVLLRTVRLAESHRAMFSASRLGTGDSYRLDYSVPSSAWVAAGWKGPRIPSNSSIADCLRVGFTSKRLEDWPGLGPVFVEGVAVSGLPGSVLPRVVGLLRPSGASSDPPPLVQYLRGDATRPHDGGSKRIVAHVVNDKTPNWGGRGFAQDVKRRWAGAQTEFRNAVESGAMRLALGEIHTADVGDGTVVASLVAQKGYGPSTRPRLQYAALLSALERLTTVAAAQEASVHMPRIGTGQAGGAWEIVAELISQTLGAHGIRVTVYDHPDRAVAQPTQLGLR